MRVPDNIIQSQPWRIHDVLGDFPLEDLWQIPQLTGTLDEFDDLVTLVSRGDPGKDSPPAVRVLWNIRDLLGKWLGLGEIASTVDAPPAHSLLRQVPDELRGTADDVRFTSLPFVPLYRTPTEFAAEVANATMHGVMHLGWLRNDDDTYSPQMAVYVRPNGRLGRAYMQFIKPFRYLIVYPALERHLLKQWQSRPGR